MKTCWLPECEVTFTLRRGGVPKRFCSPRHKDKYWKTVNHQRHANNERTRRQANPEPFRDANRRYRTTLKGALAKVRSTAKQRETR